MQTVKEYYGIFENGTGNNFNVRNNLDILKRVFLNGKSTSLSWAQLNNYKKACQFSRSSTGIRSHALCVTNCDVKPPTLITGQPRIYMLPWKNHCVFLNRSWQVNLMLWAERIQSALARNFCNRGWIIMKTGWTLLRFAFLSCMKGFTCKAFIRCFIPKFF